MKSRMRRHIDAIFILILGSVFTITTVLDSIDGQFYLASRYGFGNTLLKESNEIAFWVAVVMMVVIGTAGIALGLFELKKARTHVDEWS